MSEPFFEYFSKKCEDNLFNFVHAFLYLMEETECETLIVMRT